MSPRWMRPPCTHCLLEPTSSCATLWQKVGGCSLPTTSGPQWFDPGAHSLRRTDFFDHMAQGDLKCRVTYRKIIPENRGSLKVILNISCPLSWWCHSGICGKRCWKHLDACCSLLGQQTVFLSSLVSESLLGYCGLGTFQETKETT